jgi:fructosamine-3-kinase
LTIAEALAAETGRRVAAAHRVGGGCINEGWRVDFEDGGRAFVKTRQDVAAGEYGTEARSLRWLAEASAVRTPEVIAVRDGDDDPRLLALAWIEEGRLDAVGAEELGRGLAALHGAGAEAFGARWPLRLGELTLPNEPLADWAEFYAEQRLRPLVPMAVERGSLSRAGAAAVERVCDRIAELTGPPEPPARLHGDLWSGNVLAGRDGRAWLIDPASYGGHREVDLAMLRLFGAPSPRVLDAYAEATPLAAGHEDRVALWQLFPLLVHAVLFGGGYGASVDASARRYAG